MLFGGQEYHYSACWMEDKEPGTIMYHRHIGRREGAQMHILFLSTCMSSKRLRVERSLCGLQ